MGIVTNYIVDGKIPNVQQSEDFFISSIHVLSKLLSTMSTFLHPFFLISCCIDFYSVKLSIFEKVIYQGLLVVVYQ